MADTYYLWYNFVTDDGTKFAPGDKVTASTLGVDDVEFAAYVESGAVRKTQYPEIPAGFTGSPAEFRVAQLAAAALGEDYDVAQAAANGEAFAEPTPEKKSDAK